MASPQPSDDTFLVRDDTPAVRDDTPAVRDDTPAVRGDTLAGYVVALENVFVSIRGRGVQWSADDRARAQRWYGMGVPLPRVTSAIRDRARAWRFVQGDLATLPVRLSSYEKAVLGRPPPRPRADLPADPGTPSPSRHGESPGGESLEDRLVNLLHELPALAEGADDPAIEQAYKRAGRSLERSLRGETAATAQGLDEVAVQGAIRRANRLLRRTALEGIGSAAASALQAEVEGLLKAEPPMSLKARRRRREALLDKLLGTRYGLLYAGGEGWRGRR